MSSGSVDLGQNFTNNGVSSLNGLTGALTLVAGSGITVTPSGSNITIASTGGGGTVSSVSVVSANGFAGSVATATTTPAITLTTTITGILQGNGTSISAVTIGNLTDAGTDGIIITGGTGAVIGSGTSLAQHVADATHNGYLSSADWSTFNNKQDSLTLGDLTDAGTDGIVVTGGIGAIIGSGASLAQHVADATHNGYLSSSDWSTFNNKQSSGAYITDLTGDGTASGPGSAALTLTTVNSNVGAFTLSSITVNAKGLVTAASSSSTTGSGPVVLQTNPALVTPNLGTPSAVVLTSGTGLPLTTGVTGVLPVGNGGTNSSSALSNNRVMQSSAGAVVEAAAITASRALVSDANGIPIASSVTSTELGYVSGVTSAIQTQLDSKLSTTSVTAKVIYVSQDTGNDSNAGSYIAPLKTIQAGINKAELIAAYFNQVVVNVTPSSTGTGYNENLTFSQQGVTLQSFSPNYRSDSAVIKGTITINLTGTSGGGNYVAASNIIYIKGFVITTNSGNTVTFSGSTFQRLFLDDTYIDNTGTGSGLVLTNTGSSGGSKSTITCRNSDINNNNATNPAILVSAGRLFIAGMAYDIQNNNASGPAIVMDGASATAAVINMSQATITGPVSITDNTAFFNLSLATISSGSAAGLVTPSTPSTGFVTLANVGFTTTATNTITGSGVVALLGLVVKLSTGGDIISTVTQATINSFPQGSLMLGAAATQNTNTLLTIKNGHVTSQQTTAPTSALQAGAGSTATRTLTRCTDTAGNISITTAGIGIAAGAQLIVTFNKAHATAPVVVIAPANVNAPVTIGAYVTSSTTTFTINFAVAGITGTAYAFTYQVIET